MRHRNVRNADEVEVREMIKGRHNMRLRQLGKPAGSIALGATLTEVAPGGISFPRHAHNVNEEAIYVLSGSGEARIGDARVPVRPGAVAIGSSAETEPVPGSSNAGSHAELTDSPVQRTGFEPWVPASHLPRIAPCARH